MSSVSKNQLALIFNQLAVLRESLWKLEKLEKSSVHSLRGHQTVFVRDALHASFVQMQSDIARIEVVLSTVAEATGDIPKL